MAQQIECGYCQPHWTLRDLSFTLGKSRIIPRSGLTGGPSMLSYPVMMHYRACLDKLNCILPPILGFTALDGTDIKIPEIVPADQRWSALHGNMGWMPGPALNSKLEVKFKGLADGTQKKVCCRGAIAGNIGGRWLNCCDAKREIICDCYARQGTPGQPAPSAGTIKRLTKSCCFESRKEGIEIPLYISFGFADSPTRDENTLFITTQLNRPDVLRDVEAQLHADLKDIGGRGAGPLSCTGSGGVGNQFNPIESPILSTWGPNCICDQADKCP
jgi:hypothetical protein